MLIDLHCHTLPLSQCSSLHPEELIDLARRRGLDGVCLTEHDTPWDPEALADLGRRTGFLVLGAMELSTDLGHVLAFGMPAGPAHFASAAEAFRAASAAGGLLFLAHPARDGLRRVSRESVDFFASVEAINGSDSRLQNLAASELARGFPLPGIGGSDAHAPAEVGRAATRFEAQVTDAASLLAALRSGRYEAMLLD
jgi:hypothetical protein